MRRAALCIVVALGGCTLINPTAEFLPDDGVDGGTSDAAVLDGSVDASTRDAAPGEDAATSDAGTDAGASDACTTYTITLSPVATGAASYAPELDMRGTNAAGELIVSDYFKTTPQNRNFRRGIMEFEIPAEAAAASGASLLFRTQMAPTEAHVVYAYTPANGFVDINDYDRSALPAGVITVEAIEYDLDVLEHVTPAAGAGLGFRVQFAPPLDNATDLGSRSLVVQNPSLVIVIPCGD